MTRNVKFGAVAVVIAVLAAALLIGWLTLGEDDGDEAAIRPRVTLTPPAQLPATAPQPRLGVLPAVRTAEDLRDLAPAPTPEAEWDALAAEAEAEGTVPLIVQVRGESELLGRRAPTVERAVIVRTQQRVLRELAGTEYESFKRFTSVPIIALHATPEAIEELRRSDDVVAVAEDRLTAVQPGQELATPEGLTKLEDGWDIPVTGMDKAWKEGYDGRGQLVAIIDSGVAANHAWLRDRVAAEACYSTTANCPGGGRTATGSGSGRACSYAPADCAHGTHTGHTAAGEYGVARRAQIVAVQVFSRFTGADCAEFGKDSPCALSYDSDQMKGLEYVLRLRRRGMRIASVNISIGGGKHKRHCDDVNTKYRGLIASLRKRGVATFVSSGNEGYTNGIGHPACISTAISVGATTLNRGGKDAVASFSNSARFLNLLAPGDDIYSAVPPNAAESWDGTSMAAPHAAGAFAVLRQLQPTGSVRPLLRALANSGPRVADRRRGAGARRKPRINVWTALVRLYND